MSSNKDSQRESQEGVFENQLFVAISGLIGAGKTTLAEALSKELNLPVYYEPVVNNVYLADFYKDQKRYGFNLQVYLLNNRFRQQQQIIWSGKGGISDRSIYEDGIFAKMLYKAGNIDERDYKTYVSLFNNMSSFMKRPNLIIHLDVKPEESLRRIKERARGAETGITLEYLTALYNGYEEFLDDISRHIPVIRVNWNTYQTADVMAKVIHEKYKKMRSICNVDFEGVLMEKSQ